jgi:restriction modification system DNA specificity domain protein
MKMQLYKLNQLLLDMHSGGTPDTSKPEYWNGHFKWLSSGETRQRFIENTESRITQLGIEKSSTKLAKKNDVVMACAGQGKTRGQVSFLLDDMYINQSVIAMTTDEKILHPLYLFYNLSGRYNELRGSSDASSTRGSITTKSLKKLAMMIPNIESQKNITDILSAYDNLIQNNNNRIKLLEKMAENLYKEWFVRFRFPGCEDVRFENGIPIGWKIKRIKDFGQVITGKTPSTEISSNYGDKYLFIKTPDMHDNMYVIDSSEKLSEHGNDVQKLKKLPRWSIMVSCIGTGGVVSINSKEAHTNQQINSIVLHDKNNIEWLFFVCKSLKTTIEMFGATGSTMTNLSKGKFENLKILEPNLELIDKYHMYTHDIFKEVEKLMYSNENLINQRDMLLPRLMSGKLEV